MGFDVAKEIAAQMQTSYGCGAGTAVLFLESLLDFYSRRGRFPEDIRPPVTPASWDLLSQISNPEYVSQLQDLGDYGTILVREGHKAGSEFVQPAACQIPLFLSEREQSEQGGFDLQGVLICVLSYPVTKEEHVTHLLECATQWNEHPFIIVAPFIAGKALETIRLNRVKGVGKFYCLASKSMHADRIPSLEDIAAISGARVIHSSFPVEMVDGEWFGSLQRVVAEKTLTTCYSYEDKAHLIDKQIARLEASKGSGFNWDESKVEERIASLDGGLVELRICGHSKSDTKWLMSRAEDEIALIRSTSKHGVVIDPKAWLDTCPEEWKACCRWWDLIPSGRIDPAPMWTESIRLAKSAVTMITSTEVALCQTQK